MKKDSEHKFTQKDIGEVITFCRDYHLDITKQSSGRTGTGPRGLGGEIDAFGPGKLCEIAVSKLLSTAGKKKCSVDNKIYSNYEVGIKTIPDIVGVFEKGKGLRDPKLYIEVKKISSSDKWLGIHTDQLKSIMRDSRITIDQIFLVFAEVYFDDNNNKKQQDFLGAYLHSVMSKSQLSFGAFSRLKDLKCKIHYVLSVRDLKQHGHEYKAGDIIPEFDYAPAKQVFLKNGGKNTLINEWNNKLLKMIK